jgi:hypothetical protein
VALAEQTAGIVLLDVVVHTVEACREVATGHAHHLALLHHADRAQYLLAGLCEIGGADLLARDIVDYEVV